MTFWVFGDSYMQHNDNYIKDIGKLIGASDCRVLGVGGSGLLYTYKTLLDKIENIDKDDAVLIGLTNRSRWLFGEKDEWHAEPFSLNKEKAYKHRQSIWTKGSATNKTARQIAEIVNSIPDEYYKAAEGYVKYLLSDTQQDFLAHSIVSSVIHSIVPSLSTKKVAVVRTLPAVTSISYNIPDYFKDSTTLFHIGSNYLVENKGFDSDDMKGIISELNTHNHWIDEPEYKEYFFKEIDPNASIIWGSTKRLEEQLENLLETFNTKEK